MDKIYSMNDKELINIDNVVYDIDQLRYIIQFYKLHNFNIDEQQWYNILLQSNADDLSNICYTNKMTKQICDNKQFWVDKGLSLDKINISSKISDRIKLLKINDLVNNLIQLFIDEYKITKYFIGLFIYFIDEINPDVKQLLPFLTYEITQLDQRIEEYIETLSDEDEIGQIEQKIYIRLFENNDITLHYYYEDINGDEIDLIDSGLTMEQLKDFLIRLFFYHSRIDIQDDNNNSYIRINFISSIQDKLISL